MSDCYHINLIKQVGALDGGPAKSTRYRCQNPECGAFLVTKPYEVEVRIGAAQHLKREQEPAPRVSEPTSDGESYNQGHQSGYREGALAAKRLAELAAQPPQELVSLVAKWREEAVKGRAKARRVAKNSELTMQELTEYDSAMERCADEIEAALTRGVVGG